MSKVRKIDFSPDEFLAAVSGELSMAEVGLYWMICSLIYSRRGPIENDLKWLRAKFRQGSDQHHLERCLNRLIETGRVSLAQGKLEVSRALAELERAVSRMEAARERGLSGGRPSNKNNELEKGSGSAAQKLSPSSSPSSSPSKENIEKKDAPADAFAGDPAEASKSGRAKTYTEHPSFAEFYLAYPRKEDRRGASKAFDRLMREGVPVETLMAGVKAYAAEVAGSARRFIKQPETFLNKGAWTNEYTAPPQPPRPPGHWEVG